ncbi:cache domain-containing protein [Mesorhizobium marinum]|uniref:Cache domain-containing protein n=1 Tax=Mesorhizobium marinum TaxID=3228790 RepID=A0ABV3QZN4_9HYPH
MRPRLTSLITALWGFVLVGALIAAGAAVMLLRDRLNAATEDALAEAVTMRSQGLALDFARALHEEWNGARTIASEIAPRDLEAVRSSLDLVVGDGSRVSWAGIAAIDGRVTVASGGLLEGQDVSSRPWFQRGLEGDFAGDVHDALLLAKLLPSIDGEPRRFLDLSTPVKIGNDTVAVLGLHLDAAWAKKHVAESAKAMGIDAFLVDPSGNVMLSSTDDPATALDLPSIRAAQLGAAATSLETWPDGKSYFTTVLPKFGYADLPSFGWSLVARIDDGAFSKRGLAISQYVALYLAGIGLLLSVLTAVFVTTFLSPLRRLANNAAIILRGDEVYPFETRSSEEAALLSAAIARLQHNQMNESPAVASSS